jgi:putative ABC transport system ATP-binding protein
MSNNTIIQVEDIQRHVPQGGRLLRILYGVTFSVEAGSWLAISGPSGAGKSTLLAILAGLERPSGGKVYIEGTEISALPEGRLARLRNEKIGLVFQSPHLLPTLSALENVEAPLHIHPQGRQARALATHMLEQVGLGSHMRDLPHQLSVGEQQRVAIARALACGPEILLTDEPTGDLDTATSRQVLDLLKELRNQLGLTIVMVTQNPAVAVRANQQLHLLDGRLVEPVPDPVLASPLIAAEVPA